MLVVFVGATRGGGGARSAFVSSSVSNDPAEDRITPASTSVPSSRTSPTARPPSVTIRRTPLRRRSSPPTSRYFRTRAFMIGRTPPGGRPKPSSKMACHMMQNCDQSMSPGTADP